MPKKKIPQEVTDFINSRKADRKPVHAPGQYENYANSKTSACWGNHGGMIVNNRYKVAMCQPSRRSANDPLMMFFDYIELPQE